MLTPFDEQVRGALTRSIAELGYAPPNASLAAMLSCSEQAVDRALLALHDAHALLLHPGTTTPWVVHPFALSPGSCWVEVGERGWWANCLYCALGIAAAVGSDAQIVTRIGGERETVVVQVRRGVVEERDLLFHLSTPPRLWWDNVIHACASFQPFRSEADIDLWCARHALPKGAVVPLPQLWDFARDWYGSYLQEPWHKRSAEEAAALFRRHGFTSPFWTSA
jgi:Alkylmercury lyase